MAENRDSEKLQLLLEHNGESILFKIFVTNDRLKVFIDAARPDSAGKNHKTAKLEELLEAGKETFKKLGADQNVLEGIIKDLNLGRPVERRRIARGTAPIDGIDGRLELLVKKYNPEFKRRDDESAQLRKFRSFDNLKAGQIVAKIHHPQRGTDGKDVFGDPIPAKPGQPYKITIDRSLKGESAADFDLLIAQQHGCLIEQNGTLSLASKIVINDDIDFKTGDFDFIGKIEISGSVQKDFKLAAADGVEIRGSIEEGHVHSSAGGILVGDGIIGNFTVDNTLSGGDAGHKFSALLMRNPNAFAAKSIKAARIQGAVVDAYETIEVSSEVLNSAVRTQGALSVTNGQLLGGITFAAAGVEAKIIGSHGGGKTIICLSASAANSLRLAETSRQIREQKDAARLLALALGPYGEDPEKAQALSEPYRTKILTLLQKKLQVDNSLEALVQQENLLGNTLSQADTLLVSFGEVMHGGVEIEAGGQIFSTSEDISGPKTVLYSAAERRFEVTPFKPVLGSKLRK